MKVQGARMGLNLLKFLANTTSIWRLQCRGRKNSDLGFTWYGSFRKIVTNMEGIDGIVAGVPPHVQMGHRWNYSETARSNGGKCWIPAGFEITVVNPDAESHRSPASVGKLNWTLDADSTAADVLTANTESFPRLQGMAEVFGHPCPTKTL